MRTPLRRGDFSFRFNASRSRVPRFTYMGAGAKIPVLDRWLEITSKSTRYIDLTAGSNNQPYLIAQTHKIPVATNDGSYYSYCISTGLFQRTRATDCGAVLEALIQAASRPKSHLADQYKISTPEVRQFVDAWVEVIHKYFGPGDREFILACTGSALLKCCTFRAGRWLESGILTGQRTLTPPMLANAIFRSCVQRNPLRCSVEATSSHDTAGNFVKKYRKFKDATVSFDPAWPYADDTRNPYHVYHELGEILKGEATPAYIWENSVEQVLGDIKTWVGTCLRKGAREVCLWNQTTNKPSKEDLIEAMRQDFKVDVILEVEHLKRNSTEKFLDYVLRMT